MTIGERIQQYRKDLGMSQEELGQNLFVSRQTVSQWETDQTLPTVDNLLRLKELFGISVDEILEGQAEEKADEKDEEKPLETYRMTFTADELKARKRAYLWRSSKPVLILLASLFVAVLINKINRINELPSSFVLGAFTIVLIFFIVIFAQTWKQITDANERIMNAVFCYSVFYDYLIAEKAINGEIILKEVIPFSDIRSISESGNLTVVGTPYGAFLLKTSELPRNSAITHLKNEIVLRTQFTKATGVWRFLSIALCVLAYVTWPLAMLLSLRNTVSVTATDLSAAEVYRNSWIAYLFLPVPIASIVLGFILKKKHFYYKKNIIIGIFIIISLCVFGSAFLLFAQ